MTKEQVKKALFQHYKDNPKGFFNMLIPNSKEYRKFKYLHFSVRKDGTLIAYHYKPSSIETVPILKFCPLDAFQVFVGVKTFATPRVLGNNTLLKEFTIQNNSEYNVQQFIQSL